MFSAGAISATLSGNFSPAGFMAFDRAMHKSAAVMDAQEKKMAAAGTKGSKALTMVGKAGAFAAAGGILAFGLAVGKSVSLAADFEQELSRLKATTGANAKQMDIMKKSAMEAGAATKFSALDAAKAQTELAKGGLAVAQIAGGGLKAALALAAAGEMELADAAATVVNAMKQFKLPAEDAVHVADALATAANTTTADVGHFAMALTQGGAAAKAIGLNLDETVAILEAFADNSVKGSDAGTSLKTMLTQLANPTDKQTAAAKRLNLELFDQRGQLKPLPALAKELDSAFGGMTNKQRLAAAATLAGTDGMRGLLALYSSSPAKMQAYLDGLEKEGTAAETAAEKQDNLRGKIENLKGSLETAGIALGEGLLPGLTEGAEKLTGTINRMAASGDLEAFGRNLGDVLNSIVEGAPAAAEALQAIGSGIGDGLSIGGAVLGEFYREIGMIVDGVLMLANAWNAIPFNAQIDTSGLTRWRDELQATEDVLRGVKVKVGDKLVLKADASQARAELKKLNDHEVLREKVVKILADDSSAQSKIKALVALGIPRKEAEVIAKTEQARAALASIKNLDLQVKVLRILGNNTNAAAKVKQIRALGIPAKTAQILANNGQALGAIGSVTSAINSMPASKTVTLTTITRNVTIGAAKGAVGRASGKAPGGAERALVGEGSGPEAVGNPRDGWAWVTSPMLWDLKPQDAVIPFESAMSGRALGLMAGLLGIPGYHKGRGPHKHAKGGRAIYASNAPLPIPDAVKFGAVPEEEAGKRRDEAREAYQKRKDRVHDLDVDITAQRRKVRDAKGPAKTKARARLRDLEADRKRYAYGGKGVPNSLADLRTIWQELKRQFAALHTTNVEIERLNKIQETDRTLMSTASKTGNEPAWLKARDHRNTTLKTLRDMYAKAVELAKPDSSFKAELEGQLASIEGEIADAATDAFGSADAGGTAAERLAETGMTDAEREHLARLEAQQSLAGLTPTLDDDRAAAGGIASFLEGILGAVLADPARGGPESVRSIADQLKQARDNIASFSGGGGGNANQDLQAQLDQRDEQLRVARRESEINAAALSVFQTWPGNAGGGNGQVVVNQNFSSMGAPTDPKVMEDFARTAVGGMDMQASRRSPRTLLGV